MTVVGIIPSGSGRSVIRFDNGYTMPLYAGELREYRIASDGVVDEYAFAELKEIVRKRMYNRILYLLGERDRTSGDIRLRLVKSGYYEKDAEEAVEYFVRQGYIDDERFIRNYIESSIRNRKHSRQDIFNHLYRYHADIGIAEDILKEYDFDESDAICAYIVRKGYVPEEVKELDHDVRNRLIRSLLGRGFSIETVMRICS